MDGEANEQSGASVGERTASIDVGYAVVASGHSPKSQVAIECEVP